MTFGDFLIYILAYFGLFTTFYFIATLIRNKESIYPEKLKKYSKITIVIPVFNGEKVLRETANSLLKLNYPKEKLDLIIVDDGSTDKTLKIAKTYEKKGFRVFTKKHAGKGEALNFALKKAKGEFFAALDADSYAEKDSLLLMMPYFEDDNIMAVTPSMRIQNPKNWLQKIQQIEYLIGIFLRKIFAFLGSIHVTPGPLSIYRKKFFDKYGGYDETTLTEDIELALRIQKYHYQIENAIVADVYTKGPSTFKSLLKQRLRWYKGFFDNVIKYKELFGAKHGNLGLFILPASLISVFLVVISLFYTLFKMSTNSFKYLKNLQAVNFDFFFNFKFTPDLFKINMNSTMILAVILLIFGIIMIILAKKLSKEKRNIKFSYVLYITVYWFLFGFWWFMALIYKTFNKKISWGGRRL